MVDPTSTILSFHEHELSGEQPSPPHQLSTDHPTDHHTALAPQQLSTSEGSSAPQPQFCCGCTRLCDGQPCSNLFTPQYYQIMRDKCAEMSRGELDNVLLGQVMAFTNNDEITRKDSFRHPGKHREQVKSTYYHNGHQICWKTFTYLHGIGKADTHSN